MTTTKRKRVSKKSKTAWRKHTDIKDVEAFLEDQRLEERLGTPFAIKSDAELFTIDAEPASEASTRPVHTTKQRKRLQLVNNKPKCFAALENTSKVQDPNRKRNTVRRIGSRLSDLSRITRARKLEKGIAARKMDESRSGRRRTLEARRKEKLTREDFSVDLWGVGVPKAKEIPETLQTEWLSKDAQLQNIPVAARIKRPAVQKSKLTIPAVEVPHPGNSYNPSYEDHQSLLRQVVEKEQILMKKEEHLKRVTTKMFRLVSTDERQTQWLSEMLSNIPTPKKPDTDVRPGEADESEASDNEYKAINPPVRNKKKDTKARRKQKEAKAERERLKRAKIDKKKIADMYKLRFLERAIENADERLASLRVIRQRQRELRASTGTAKLNKHKYKEADVEFVDGRELSGNLRNVSGKLNLLRDRYLSLQKRSILAPSTIQMKKKRKLKSYFKSGHKVTDEDIAKYI